MPVKHIRNRVQSQQGFELIGTLSKGTPDMIELDHFRLKLSAGYEYLRPFFQRSFGDMKRIDRVFVLGVEVETAFTYWYEQYNDETGQFEHRCDGENRVKYRNDKGHVVSGKLPCLKASPAGECECNPRGRLHCRLERIEGGTGVQGRYLFTTGSMNDILHILSKLRDIANTVKQYGHELYEVPLIIERVPDVLKTDDGNGGFGESLHYMINITADPDFIRRLSQEKRNPEKRGNASYLPYLESAFLRFMPDGVTFADFAGFNGFSVSDYVARNPNLDAVKRAVIDYLVDSSYSVRVERIRVGRKGKRYQYYLDIGFGVVVMYSTKILKPLIDVSPFRQRQGASYMPAVNLRVILKRNKSNDNIRVADAFIGN